MSNTITAYFKGRVGVCESVYQYDTGMVLVLDGIDLGEAFVAYFDVSGAEDAIPAIGQEDRVAIPNSCLTTSGNVTVHIPINEGENDSEVEYVVTFRVIGRARPVDDVTSADQSVIAQAIALVRTAWSRWTNMIASAITLQPGSSATAEYSDGTLTLGIPRGHGIRSVFFDEDNKLHVILTDDQEAESDPVTEIWAINSTEFTKSATLTSSVSSVALDMTGYEYRETDIIDVFINGLRAIPTVDYTISTVNNVATLTFTMLSPVSESVYIRAIKGVSEG